MGVHKMDIEKVEQDLNKRFAEPLPEFYKRRIIVWYDEDREFESELENLNLSNAKIISLTGSNTFYVKKTLCNDDTTSNYLLYRPVTYVENDDNWLLDIELYSEDFRADLISMYQKEAGIPDAPEFRKIVKTYKKFFNAKDRRQRLSLLSQNIERASDLHLAVMSAICKLQELNRNLIIRTVLEAGLDNDTNTIYQEMVNYDAHIAFWKLAQRVTGYSDEHQSLEDLMAHILMTALSRTMDEEYLKGLERFISFTHQAYCYDLVSDWLVLSSSDILREYARNIEETLRLRDRFMRLEIEDIYTTECFPCINECILIKLMSDIKVGVIDVNRIRDAVEKRRTAVWYDSVKNYYEGILQVANMHEFYKEHSIGFHTVEPEKFWKEYTSEYYKMDTYYRWYHLQFNESINNYNSELHDLFNEVTNCVEAIYTNWYLKQLGESWTNICEDYLKEYGCIPSINRQESFYTNKIKNADTNIYVIISDALRYEVAAQLSEELQRETQSKVSLGSMQSIFPSVTKFGMAALLPHKELTVEYRNDKITVLADGGLTESNYRDKILKNANPNSVALSYKDIVTGSRADRKSLVKGMKVVYIYHDTIDDTAHSSDTKVFSACDSTISELKNAINVIVNDFGGTNIIITSDHGFLYTYSLLTEEDKVSSESFKGQHKEIARRYAICEQGATPDYLMPVKFLQGKTEFSAFTPKENIRIKINGGGLNFVHGGVSLQEMVVPVMEYKNLRNDSKEYKKNKEKYDTKPVTVSLLSATKKVSNMIFSLNFYQKEAVSTNREAANYSIYFTDANGKQISDIQRIIADKTSENGQDRTFRCTFNLKSMQYSITETYYLVIADETGLTTPERAEFQIDIPFAVDEFDF